MLEQDYAATRIMQDDDGLAYAYDTMTRYMRVPDDKRDLLVFQDASANSRFTLKSWQLLDNVEVQPCQTVRLRSWWQAETPVDVSMTLVIVDGATGQGAANTDGPPLGRPAYSMQPDRLYADERAVTVPCDAAPGEYPLMLGFYQVVNSQILPLEASLPDKTPVGNLAYLTTLFVK
jgi:hypothetical protein